MKQKFLIVCSGMLLILFLSALPIWKPYLEIYNGQLAVIAFDDGTTNSSSVYLLNPYVNYWKRLTPSGMNVFEIAWSPDGKSIAFVFLRDSKFGIGLLGLKDDRIETIDLEHNNIGWIHALTWAPDGESLIFDAYDEKGMMGFYKLNIKTQSLVYLDIPDATQLWRLRNSFVVLPQGNLVIERDDGLIYIMSTDLQDMKLVSKGTNLFLSPDGSNITFFCRRPDLYLCHLNTVSSKVSVIVSERKFFGDITNPSWSQDEKYIVYLQGGGESDPSFIQMYDFENGRTYTVFESQKILDVAWYSKE